MLYLTMEILKAAGLEYDDIEETWIVPVLLRSEVAIECDENDAYILESLLELQAVLESSGCTFNSASVKGHYVSIVGLTARHAAAA